MARTVPCIESAIRLLCALLPACM